MGWDNLQLTSATIEANPQYFITLACKEIMDFHSKLGDGKLDSNLPNFLAQFKTAYSKISEAQLSLAQRIQLEAYEELFDLRRAGKSYAQIFSSEKYKNAMKYEKHFLTSLMPQNIKQRNRSMEKTIKAYPGIFKIVIAGKSHFLEDSELVNSFQ